MLGNLIDLSRESVASDDLEPAQALLAGIIRQAIADAAWEPGDGATRKHLARKTAYRDDARAFLFERPQPFETYCAWLDLDPERVRAAARRSLSEDGGDDAM